MWQGNVYLFEIYLECRFAVPYARKRWDDICQLTRSQGFKSLTATDVEELNGSSYLTLLHKVEANWPGDYCRMTLDLTGKKITCGIKTIASNPGFYEALPLLKKITQELGPYLESWRLEFGGDGYAAVCETQTNLELLTLLLNDDGPEFDEQWASGGGALTTLSITQSDGKARIARASRE